MRRMEKVTGRTDDMMIVRGVNVFPTQVEEQILAVKGLSPHYQIELQRVKNLDSLKLRGEFCDSSTDKAKASDELTRLIKSYIGISVTVEVVSEGRIPRSQGKAQRVLDFRYST